jgi:predicted nucleic acid-binding protein
MNKNNIIVDTNIIFSSLLSEKSKFRSLILDRQYNFFSPNYVFVELFTIKEKILKYTNLSYDELLNFLSIIISKINFIQNDFVTKKSKQLAYKLCVNIDMKDIPFVALTIELDGILWTGDKKLINGLLSKGFNSFFN